MRCPDCDGLLIKASVQNEEADWLVFWGCDCKLDKTLPIEEAGNKQGISLFVHNGRCSNLEEAYK